MNRRTSQNQRKIRIPTVLRRQPKKEPQEEVVAKADDPSCQTRGCGCGN
ncbi:hypothetical protein N9M68_02200 [Candidatus Poseidonia alphae]|nr:hypothetical protein [Candidatus Poseidonia alphae]MDA8529990.1 hypothetical protein [Candidatus Poseidonia alphae]MDA8748928.1 hypothetical protein [Candidatus Poseidonia alphae]